MSAEEILQKEEKYCRLLECDGATRLLHYALTEAGLEHNVYCGEVLYKGHAAIPWHFWIELKDGRIIDIKAGQYLVQNMFTRVDRITDMPPHGIFFAENVLPFMYLGDVFSMEVNKNVYQLLKYVGSGTI